MNERFNQDFPELEGKGYRIISNGLISERDYRKDLSTAFNFLHFTDVNVHCLSKQRTKEMITSFEEEFFHIIGEDSGKKTQQIVQALLKELKL